MDDITTGVDSLYFLPREKLVVLFHDIGFSPRHEHRVGAVCEGRIRKLTPTIFNQCRVTRS